MLPSSISAWRQVPRSTPFHWEVGKYDTGVPTSEEFGDLSKVALSCWVYSNPVDYAPPLRNDDVVFSKLPRDTTPIGA